MLLDAGTGPIADLEKAIAGAGYAVLLTDSRGYASGGGRWRSSTSRSGGHPPRRDLSEGAIGTSAMACCALKERRPVQISGRTLFSANRLFHSCQAPIVDPRAG